jgi:hypothetical protein
MRLAEVMDLLCRSKTSLDARVCKPLLGSCRTRRNVELVEHVTECMVLKLDTTADILDGNFKPVFACA